MVLFIPSCTHRFPPSGGTSPRHDGDGSAAPWILSLAHQGRHYAPDHHQVTTHTSPHQSHTHPTSSHPIINKQYHWMLNIYEYWNDDDDDNGIEVIPLLTTDILLMTYNHLLSPHHHYPHHHRHLSSPPPTPIILTAGVPLWAPVRTCTRLFPSSPEVWCTATSKQTVSTTYNKCLNDSKGMR